MDNLTIKQIPICFDESDNSCEGGQSKIGFAHALAGSIDEISAP